jgi:hypothetical protein
MICVLIYRLGWLIRFISHSVISGFTTASAIVIGLSQIKYFLGYSVTRSSKIIPLIESIIGGIDQVGFAVSVRSAYRLFIFPFKFFYAQCMFQCNPILQVKSIHNLKCFCQIIIRFLVFELHIFH